MADDGSSGDGPCWTNLAKIQAANYDIMLPDERGHGLTDPPAKSDAADAQTEDLERLITELELEKPIVIGHSMGSSSVACFATKHPHASRSGILAAPRLIPRLYGTGAANAADSTHVRILSREQASIDDLVQGCVGRSPSWRLLGCQI